MENAFPLRTTILHGKMQVSWQAPSSVGENFGLWGGPVLRWIAGIIPGYFHLKMTLHHFEMEITEKIRRYAA